MIDLQAMADEIERLRDLLSEHGIDPEPYVAPPVKFGPPTRAEFLLHEITANAFASMARQFVAEQLSSAYDVTDEPPAQIDSTLRIRMPNNYLLRATPP